MHAVQSPSPATTTGPRLSTESTEFVWPDSVPSACSPLTAEEWREKYLLAQEQLDFICQMLNLPPGNIGLLAVEAYQKAIERGDRLSAPTEAFWHPRIGDPVKASEHFLSRFGEWARVPLWIVGIQQEPGVKGQNVTVTDKWPLCSASRPYTDGFYINRTNGVPDDLMPRACDEELGAAA